MCCDYYEPGYGYVFTSCGGGRVVILNDRINSTKSEQVKTTGQLEGLQQAVWNFTELQQLVLNHCNNTYLPIDEYSLSGAFEMWLMGDFPW